MDAKAAERDPAERVQQLKDIFLNYATKFNSPDFIVPDNRVYDKQETINDLTRSFSKFKDSTENANLKSLVEGLPFGPVTKWEILHFVLYHSTRHLDQLKRIVADL